MKKFTLVLLAGLLVLALTGSALAVEPIKIGLNLEMTGAVAAYGQMGYEGLQLIQELVKPEVLGRPVQLVLMDNKSDKAEAAIVADRLIEKEKVVAIIGTMTSSALLSAGAEGEKYKVPMIGPSTTNPLVTQGKKYVFRACFIDPFQGKIAAKFAYDQLKARRAAILVDVAQDYCVGLGKFFEDEFKRLGGRVVAKQFIKTGDQDFSAQLTAIKNANPDILYIPNYYTEIALAARQARALGIKAPILSGDGADAPELVQIGGDAVEGLMHTAFWHEKAAMTPLGKKYVEAYRKKYGKEPNAFGALAADSYLIILDAIKRAKSADPTKIRDAIEATKNLEVVTGTVTIENGDAIKPVVIRKVVNGKFEYLATVNP
ncbi:MAG: ABC transporter substrate-binding protein [Bacillota bacterium]|nr:ABC transporter substrate-binding protein [Bacillota bacterium]